MVEHLESILAETPGIELSRLVLGTDTFPNYQSYHHLVFCGYDHTTFAHLHLALSQTDPNSVRITLYDEPGASIERELNTLLFRGVDVNSRIPSSSVIRLVHSWSHRDIVAFCSQDVIKYAHEDPERPTGDAAGPKPAKPAPRTRSGNTRARQVEAQGAAPTRERDGGVDGGGGDGSGG